MKQWKGSEEAKKVHEELYEPSIPDDQSSDSYLTMIIKSVFTDEKELTHKNAVWTQAVLETIFDERYTSSKIESEPVDMWIDGIENVISMSS
jgi:hypothetical protein